MEKDSNLIKVQDILANIMDKKDLQISESTMLYELENWNSMMFFEFISRLQDEFSIKFSFVWLRQWKTIGDVVKTIEDNISNNL